MSGRVLARCERRRHVLATDDGEVLGSACVALALPMGFDVDARGVHSTGLLTGARILDDLAPGASTVLRCPSCHADFLLDHDELRRVHATPNARPMTAPRAT